MKRIIVAILLMTASAAFCQEGMQKVKVSNVADGDTVYLLLDNQPVSTRLIGIDCFETGKINRAYRQAYEGKITIEEVIKKGEFAKYELQSIIKQNDNEVYFKCSGVDKYGRLLGEIYAKNHKNINKMMLKTGFCNEYLYNE